jgi:glycosyltransferase involved in cell wall biosynthesis
MRILISAHELSPFQGSECAVGWNLVLNISNYHEVTVVYAATNQFNTRSYFEDVSKFLGENKVNHKIKFISIPQPRYSKILIYLNKLLAKDKSSIGIPYLYFATYRLWQKSVYIYVSKNIDLSKIDLIHHLTSISFREPGYLWKIDKPFVWGPISGNVKIPKSFFSLLNLKQKIFQNLRNLIIDLELNYSFRVRNASKKASLIYCVTKDDYTHFSQLYKNKVRKMLDVGSNISLLNKKNTDTINFVWIGRVVSSKALGIFLHSIQLIQLSNLLNNVNYTIIGDGPELEKNKNLAKKLNLKNISWLGHVEYNEVQCQLQKAHCLVHTSIREATSATILEALSASVPVICHDAFGMSYAINNTCGIKVPFVDLNTSVTGFEIAMLKIINNKDLLSSLSKNALLRSRELSWVTMGKSIAMDYSSIVL